MIGFLTVILIMCLSIILIALSTSRRKGNDLNPPGPRWILPVIGHLHLLGKRPHQTLTNLRDNYGDVISLRLGQWNTVVLSGMETVKQALMRQSEDFAGRPSFYTFEHIAKGKSMGFGDFGPRWKLHRRIAQNALALFANKVTMDNQIRDEAMTLVQQLIKHSKNGDGVDPHDEIYLSVGSIICSMCFGGKYERDDKDFLQLVRMNAEFMEYAGAGNPVDLLPWLRHFTNSSLKGFLRILQRMEDFCKAKQKPHIASYNSNEMRHISDALLRAVGEISQEEKTSVGLTDEHILSTIQEIIGAGFDTIATTLEWAILYMAMFPEVQAKVQAELDKEHDDYIRGQFDSMPYVKACILEIMRMSCIFPLALPHATSKDTNLNGYEIKAQTLVFINLWALSRDPANFPEPEMFRPERFIDIANADCINKAAFLPYSAGKRRCPGEQLAKKEIFIFFTTLLYNCEFKQIEKENYSLESKYGLTLKPHSYKVIIKRRKNKKI